MSENEFVSMFKLLKKVKSEIQETVTETKNEVTEIQSSAVDLKDQIKKQHQDLVKNLKK